MSKIMKIILLCHRIYNLRSYILMNDMGGVEEYIKQRNVELRILYKLIFDVKVINDDHTELFKFTKNIVEEYEKINNCLVKEWLSKEGVSDENYVLEDRLVTHSFEQNIKSIQEEKKRYEEAKQKEFVYSKAVYDLARLLEKDYQDYEKIGNIKQEIAVHFPKIGKKFEKCYFVAKKYLKKEDTTDCFKNLLNELDREWKSNTSLKQNPKAQHLHNRIMKYSKILGAKKVCDELIEIWKRKENN